MYHFCGYDAGSGYADKDVRTFQSVSGIINALKVVGKKKEACKVVINGAGSAGVAIAKLLLNSFLP